MKQLLFVLLLFVSLTMVSTGVYSDTRTDSDRLFDWVEENFSQYFAPPGQQTQSFENYYYRYYPQTNNYIGTNTSDLNVYVLGDIFGGLLKVDSLQNLLQAAGLSGATAQNQTTLILAVASSEKQIRLAWAADSSDSVFHLHLSTQADFTPSANTLVDSLSGIYQADVSNLQANTTYYVRIISENPQGVLSEPSNELSVTTFAGPVVENNTTIVQQAEDLGLGIATLSGSTLSIPLLGSETMPTIGNILVGETNNGGYLRWVDDMDVQDNTLVISTRSASLSDVFSSAQINSQVKLSDITASGSRGRVSRAKDASLVSTMNWQDDFLSISQTSHAVNEAGLRIQPLQADTFEIELQTLNQTKQRAVSTTSEGGLTITAEVKFEPTLTTRAKWDFLSLESAQIDAKGKLTFSLKADYNFSAAASIETEPRRLLTKTFVSRYLVGSVPVWQETTITLDATFSARAEAKIKASTEARSTTEVSLGASLSQGSGWSSYSSGPTLENTITSDISIKGGVSAEARLIPNVEVKFYQVIAGNISVEPYLKGEIEYQAEKNIELLSGYFPPSFVEARKFDVDIGVQCFVSAKLTKIFSDISLLDKTAVCGTDSPTGPLEYKLFSLPEIALSSSQSGDGVYTVTAAIKDGTHDPFDAASANWYIYPEGATMKIADDRRSVSISPGSSGSVTNTRVFFTGYGVLGENATQVEQIEIKLDSENECVSYGGRMWELKTRDGGLRDSEKEYSWNEVLAYVDQVNEQGLCGYNDWRLPTIDELESLVYCSTGVSAYGSCNSGSQEPTIDLSVFPNTVSHVYWSSTPTPDYKDSVWFVDFYFGMSISGPVDQNTLHVRLVR